MMNIKIYHRHTSKAVRVPPMYGSDRSVGKQAKTHCTVGLRMVARRTYRCKGSARPALHHCINPHYRGTCTEASDVNGSSTDDGVRIEMDSCTGSRSQRKDVHNVVDMMNSTKRLNRSLFGLFPKQRLELRGLQRRRHCSEPCRTLWMIRPRIMIKTIRVGD